MCQADGFSLVKSPLKKGPHCNEKRYVDSPQTMVLQSRAHRDTVGVTIGETPLCCPSVHLVSTTMTRLPRPSLAPSFSSFPRPTLALSLRFQPERFWVKPDRIPF